KLNEATAKDCYPLPRIDDTVDALGGSRYFTTLDLASGYWQIPLNEESKSKTAFCANSKLYEFNVMPFGLCNAPPTFQRLMDDLLKNLTWKHCLVYLDDVIVFANDFKTHMERLDEVLGRFAAANLKLRPSKCKFVMDEVGYLGFKITKYGLSPDPAKTAAINNLSAPANKDDVKRFLGMMGYYRRFIPNFSKTAACLFELTKAKSKFEWNEQREEAFKSLKKQLVQAPILIYPNFKELFELFCDASGGAIGAVLVQRLKQLVHPVAYASRQLSKQEKDYSTSERELLAIVWAVKHFYAYIFGKHFKIYTDHKPLSTLVKAKEPTGRLYRLLLKLQEFDFEILYYPGSLNFTADQLSRPPVHQDLGQTLEVKTLEFKANIDWEREQDSDKEIAIVKANLKTSSGDDWESLKFFQFWNRIRADLVIKLGILYKKDQEQLLTVVPNRLIKLVCKLYHDSISAGHLGFEKTLRAVSVRFIWPNMRADVYDYCASCDTCQKFKVKNISNKVPLVSINIDKAWDLVGIDVAGPLKKTKLGNNYFILAVNYFSKFCIGEAKSNYTGETSKEFLRDEIVNRYGTPAAIITDQGRNFESKTLKEYCDQNKIKKLRTTAYHPQCNGLTERTIRTIKQMLSMYVNGTHNNWDEILQPVIFAYNNSKHSSTNYAPNEIVFGKLMPTTADRLCDVTQGNKNESNIANVSSDKTQVVHYNRMRQYKVREKNSESECNFSGISFGIGNQGSQQEALFKIFRERNAKAGATNSEVINFEENELINFDANGEEVYLVNNLEQMNNIEGNFGELRDVQTNLEVISQNLVENTAPESSQALNVSQLVNQNQSNLKLQRQLVATDEKNQEKPDNTVQLNVENRSQIVGLDDTLNSLMDEILN
ncbi:unnamed protein product, partial [Brachionus calyciflorus]